MLLMVMTFHAREVFVSKSGEEEGERERKNPIPTENTSMRNKGVNQTSNLNEEKGRKEYPIQALF